MCCVCLKPKLSIIDKTKEKETMKRKVFDLFRLIGMIPFLEKVLVNQTQGKYFGAAITKFPPNHYQYPVNSIRKVERDGINYSLDLSDIVDWYIYFGFKEKSRLALYNLIHEGNTVIDVGANVGDITMHVANIVGEGGMVHSFEPDTINFNRLKHNLDLNLFKNIRLNNYGLGDVEGEFFIENVNERNNGMNRVVDSALKSNNATKINIIKLDTYLEEFVKVDLIKIDVEGFEFNVLKGAERLIDNYHPILFIELDDQNLREQGSSSKELIEFLEGKGYDIKHAETNVKVTEISDFINCHFDIIAS